MHAQRQALMVVDAQRAPLDRAWLSDAFAEGLASLVHEARARRVPVILVQQHCPHIAIGSEGWQLIDDIDVHPDDIVVHKSHPSAFTETGLHERLQEAGITRLVLCGLCSGGCIQSTLESAVQLGYDVAVVDDAHSTHDQEFDGVEIPAEQLIAWQNLQASEATYGLGHSTVVGRAQAFDTTQPC